MLVEGKEDAHELAEELGDSALTFSTIGSLSWVGFATILNILLPLSPVIILNMAKTVALILAKWQRRNRNSTLSYNTSHTYSIIRKS